MINKFECNILKSSYMQTSGSSLKKMIQNNSTPIIDLYVRESIQNSLDASKPNTNTVNINFYAKNFDSIKFAGFFEKIGDELISQINSRKIQSTFLAIKDSNTIGLIGREDGSSKSGEKGQNLGNLVFNIMHAQTEEGSGGCWGIGKTIFYRISSTGLVLFYSRIKSENNSYQERIVAALIEDETKNDNCLIKGDDYRGISFFGQNISKEDGNKLTKVITDPSFIEQALSCFKIERYRNEETGTIVIVPFVDFSQLCSDHPSYQSFKNNDVYWASNIATYLDIAVKRWYFPRLSNKYDNGAILRVSINDKKVEITETDDPLFNVYTNLYNAIIKFKKDQKEITYKPGDIMVEKVTRKSSIKGELGWLGFIEITSVKLRELGYGDGFLNYSPYIYAGLQEEDFNDNRNLPIVAYMRKPGMIISYNTKGDWAGNGTISSNKGSYIIALFVLNSNALIEKANMSLEEYARSGEKADHCSWNDHSLGDNTKGNKRFIKSISQGIGQILNKIYNPQINDNSNISDNVSWQNALSSWMPEGLGRRSSSSIKTTESTTSISSSKKVLILLKKDSKFVKDGIDNSFEIKSKGSFKNQQILISVHTIDKNISLKDLEENDLPPVCSIIKGFIVFDEFGKDKKVINNLSNLDINGGNISNEFTYNFLKTSKGIVYGLSLSYSGENLRARLKLRIKVFDVNNQISFTCK